MQYVGQSEGFVEPLKGENAEFLFSYHDRTLATKASDRSSSEEQVSQAVERLVNIAVKSGHADPHTALYFLDKISQSHPGILNKHENTLVEAGIDGGHNRAQKYPDVSTKFLMVASGVPLIDDSKK